MITAWEKMTAILKEIELKSIFPKCFLNLVLWNSSQSQPRKIEKQ